MIDEKKLLTTLEEWKKDSKETVGLKAPALLEKVMDEVRRQAANEEIKARIEREDARDRWIPVSEDLPADENEVDVTVECGNGSRLVDTDNYDVGDGCWVDFWNRNVVAWRPRPEPYTGEAEPIDRQLATSDIAEAMEKQIPKKPAEKHHEGDGGEPEIDWDSVPIDTPVLVRNHKDDPWIKRYFAGTTGGGNAKVWYGGYTSKTTENYGYWKYTKLLEGSMEQAREREESE